METDRPHRSNSINNSSSSSNSTTSELFICFTSRLSSSSSMKIPSKSLLSPGRAREGSQISLSNSLSRRLRSNGSMKGGQASPMFPTNGKKRGCSFENPEPSSPKVTCIGQVRVKTKKQGNKMRARSKRRGDVSFRRIEQSTSSNNPNNGGVEVGNNQNLQDYSEGLSQHQQRNQRWVDLPVTICEALRTFGAELNCFLPCRSSCMASEKVKEEGNRSSNGGCTNKENSSCGAVFRWLVAVEGDGKGREIELVVGEEEEEEEDGGGRRRSYRRHVFDEIEFSEEKLEKDNNEAEEGGRVSISVPPKNALLLMRCRSDPVKMAALANKFWEPPLPNDEEEDDNEEEKAEKRCVEVEERQEKVVVVEKEELLGHQENIVTEKLLSCPEQEVPQLNDCNAAAAALEDGADQDFQEIGDDIDCNTQEEGKEVTENPVMVSSLEGEEDVADPGNEDHDIVQDSEHGHKEQRNTEDITDDVKEDTTVQSVQTEQKSEVSVTQNLLDQEPEPQPEEPEPPEEVSLEALLIQEEEKETSKEEEEEEGEGGGAGIVTQEGPDPVTQERSDAITQEGETGRKSTERESQPLLPDCLLLMMCEPKLSMEVSKETWVCSTDFIRWLPEPSRPPVNKKNGGDEPKKRISIDLNPPPAQSNNNTTTVLQQPPRSSCSYPAKPPPRAGGAQSMATAIEQKLVNSKGFEPFVLTRCKSEPMRTAAKLAPEACFWKNRKLEPHRPATRAAGVGF